MKQCLYTYSSSHDLVLSLVCGCDFSLNSYESHHPGSRRPSRPSVSLRYTGVATQGFMNEVREVQFIKLVLSWR